MIIGIPKEIKNEEYRVGLTPFSARELVAHGHTVIVEKDAGFGIGFKDTDYEAAGVTVMPSAEAVYSQAKLIVKVKEPQASEYRLI